MLRRLALTWVALVASVCAAASCGSRTDLPFAAATRPDGGTSSPVVDGGISPVDSGTKPVSCTPGRFTLAEATAQLMLVLDRSASMAATIDGIDPPPRGQRSRWTILRDGLSQAILPFDDSIAMGAKFYPETSASTSSLSAAQACITDSDVGLAPKLGNARAILQTFDDTAPRGGTPTSEALRIASQLLSAQRGLARSIVLATDGAPNCNSNADLGACVCTSPQGVCGPDIPELCLDDTTTVRTIRDVAATGVPVYVIGLGSLDRPEFLRVLDAMAVAGGKPRPSTPRHYNVQSSADLAAALTSVRDSATRCTFLTPSAPTNPDAITISIDGRPVPRDPGGQNGWDWLDREYGSLTFFGAACGRATAGTVVATVRCDG